MNSDLATFASLWAVRSTGLLLISLLLLWAMRNASASRRHFALFLTFLALLLLPVFSAVLPVWQLAILPPAGENTEVVETVVPKQVPQPATLVVDHAVSAVPAPPRPPAIPLPPTVQDTGVAPTPSPALPLPLLVYGAVLALLLARELMGAWWLSRLGAQSRMVSDERTGGIFQNVLHILQPRQTVRLFTHPTIAVPMTWGTLLPVVLLPTSAKEWSSERLQAVLLHEVAHIYRNDALTQSIARFICLLYWWHPGVWGLGRMLAAEAERACDDLVLAAGIGGADYAHHLVAVVREANTASLPYPAISIGRPNALKARIQAILEHTRDRQRVSRRGMVLGGLIAFLLLLPSAILHLRSVVSEEPVQSATFVKSVEYAVLVPPEEKPTGLIMAKDGVAVLPNGARVSHVSTSVRSPYGLLQWNAAGEAIVPPSFAATGYTFSPKNGFAQYRMTILVNNIPTEAIDYAWRFPGTPNARTNSSSGRHASPGSPLVSSDLTANLMVPSDISKIDMDVAVGFGNGKLIASAPLPGMQGKQFGKNLKITYGKAEPSFISATSSSSQKELLVDLRLPNVEGREGTHHVVAVDLQGKEKGWKWSGDANPEKKRFAFEFKKGQLRGIRVYWIPYQWVRFPAVPLHPKLSQTVSLVGHNGSVVFPDGTSLTLAQQSKGNKAHFTFQFPNRNDIEYGNIAYYLHGSDHFNGEVSSSTWPSAEPSRSGPSKVEASYNLPLLSRKATAQHKKMTMQVWVGSNQWTTVEEYRIADLKTPKERQEKLLALQPGGLSGYSIGVPERLYGQPVRIQSIAPDGRVSSSQTIALSDNQRSVFLSSSAARNTIRIQTAPLYQAEFPVTLP